MTALYFIHGMWSTSAVWTELRLRLEAAGHTTTAAQLPFHDRLRHELPAPELAALSLKDYVDYLLEDIARLPETPVIVGHSMGSFLAQAVAARVQPPGLILLSTAPSASTAVVAFAPLRTGWGIFANWGWWKRPTIIDAERARWGIFNEVPTPVADAEIAALVWDSGRVLAELSFPWASRGKPSAIDYARLAMPALVVVGDEDRITPAGVSRSTARQLAGPVDYHEIAGAGHWLFHAPVIDRVAALTTDWLARLVPTPVLVGV